MTRLEGRKEGNWTCDASLRSQGVGGGGRRIVSLGPKWSYTANPVSKKKFIKNLILADKYCVETRKSNLPH